MRIRFFSYLFIVILGTSFFGGCKTHIAENASDVVVGPYPVKTDIDNLKDHGISRIISLLDSNDAYEDTLYLRERDYAKSIGLGFQNYEMPRDSTKPDYQSSADAAASAIANNQGKLYLHSYLTSTRTLSVERLLQQKGIYPTVYILPRRAGTEVTYALDSAQAAYQASHFENVLTILSGHQPLDRESQLLRAWATYHLDRTEEAKAEFDSVLRQHPNELAANLGVGYCDYREDSLHTADSLFSFELSRHPDDPSANAGLGLVRYKENNIPDAQKYLSNSLRIDSINVEAGNLLLKIEDSIRRNSFHQPRSVTKR